MIKKELTPKSKLILTGRDPLQDANSISFNNQSIQIPVKLLNIVGRKQSLPNLKIQSKNDIGYTSEPQSPLNSSQQTERTTNKNYQSGKSKKISMQILVNQQTPNRNQFSQLTTARSKHPSPQKNRTSSLQFNNDLKSNLTQFESLEDIGLRLRLQHYGVVTTPVSGKVQTSKNSFSKGNQMNSFTQQIQLQKEGQQIQLLQLQKEDQNIKIFSQTPKVSSFQNQIQSPPSSRFFYQTLRDLQKLQKPINNQNNQEKEKNASQQFVENTDIIAQQNIKKDINQIDRAKQNWGRPITEQKQRFASLDQQNMNDIQFENKKDEELYLKKNNPLFNKNFLGKQLALNNKTCLKALLKNNNSKEIKFDTKVFQKYQEYYRNHKLHHLIYKGSNNNTTNQIDSSNPFPNRVDENTKKLFGGMFLNQQPSPQNTNQSSNSQSYSEALFGGNGLNIVNSQSREKLFDTPTHQNNDGFTQVASQHYQQKNGLANNNKWKYNINAEDKHIAQISKQNLVSSRLQIQTNLSLNHPFMPSSYQQQPSNRQERKYSSSLFQSQNEVTRRPSNLNIPSIGQFETENDFTITRNRGGSQPLVVHLKSDGNTTARRNPSLVFIDKDQSINQDSDSKRKFTKITEENDFLDNNHKKQFTQKQDPFSTPKPRTKSTFETSLQKQISKQIGIDLQKCMPKKLKPFPCRNSSNSVQDISKIKFFTTAQIKTCFSDLNQLLNMKFHQDYEYKLILSENELSSDKFIDRFFIFLSYCLNLDQIQNTPSAPQSPSVSQNQLPHNNSTQHFPQTTNNMTITSNQIEKTSQNYFLSPRNKIGSRGGFRLSTSSQQTLRSIFTDIQISIQFQPTILEDIMEIFKIRIQDINALQQFQEKVKIQMQALLTPNHIIQEIGGKLNGKRFFCQIFQHMEERYSIRYLKYTSHSSERLDENIPNKNKDDAIIDYIISIINNEIRSFDSDRNLVSFSMLDFFFFKLSVQCVCGRQGLSLKQTYKLLEKIEQNREYLCKPDNTIISINDFTKKRALANQLSEYNSIVDHYISPELKNLSNSFIFLENIIDFVINKGKAQTFISIIGKKFRPDSIKNGLLNSIFEFVKNNIFPNFLKLNQYQISQHPLLLQLKRKLDFIEHESCSYIPPSQIWKLEERNKKWSEILQNIQNSQNKSNLEQLEGESYFKKRNSNQDHPFKINISQIKDNHQLQEERFNSKIINTDSVDENTDTIIASKLFQIKSQQNSHICLAQQDNLSYLKYIYDFAFSFYDIYSAYDIEIAKKYYQINQLTFDSWMNVIKHSFNQENNSQEEINQQVFYFKKYSLLYN